MNVRERILNCAQNKSICAPGCNIEVLDRAVINPRVDLLKTRIDGHNLLVKLFNTQGDGEREIQQYKRFAKLPFIPTLRYSFSGTNLSIAAYDWINGKNGYDFNQDQDNGRDEVQRFVLKQVICQTIEMGNVFTDEDYSVLRKEGTHLSIQNPIYPGVFTDQEKLKFNEAYTGVVYGLQLSLLQFPGIYIDRNPGNFIIEEGNRIYQVDFGVTEATSPIFDLTKLLRSRTGEYSICDFKPGFILPPYSQDFEKDILKYAFNEFSDRSRFGWKGSWEEFQKSFLYTALNEHISYLTKAVGLLKEEAEDPAQLKRKAYHKIMLGTTYYKLLSLGERVEALLPWIARLQSF